MPLIQSKSKKALSKNIEAEMNAGKPQKQSIAIAYDIKRRNSKKKKMADGGLLGKMSDAVQSGIQKVKEYHNAADPQKYPESKAPEKQESDPRKRPPKQIFAEGGYVNESAKYEKRPMPDERDQDSKMVGRNSGKKAPIDDQWLDQPTVRQAQKPSITPLSRPKMANGIYKVRDRDDVDKEEMMMSKMAPDGYGNQPDKEYNEIGANRQGPESRDLKLKMMAEGGKVDMEPSDDTIEMHERMQEQHMQSELDPSEDEGSQDAHSRNEEGQNRQGPKIPDMEREHSNGRRPYAHGGMAHEMDEQPQEEYDMEHEDSIASAIMAKKEHQKRLMSDSDEDRMVMMAEGGYLNGEDSIYSDDSDQADLRRNAEEDKNLEDQASYDAMRKENYSESEGLSQLDSPKDSNEHGHEIDSDEHDMISQIRSKMNRQRQFKVR